MQYQTGTVAVTNGSAIITGTSTVWLANVIAGDFFSVQGDSEAIYEVLSVDSDTQLTLSTNYGGLTGTGKTYFVHRDFTATNNIPLLYPRDVDSSRIITRAFNTIDGIYSDTAKLSSPNIFTTDQKISKVFPTLTLESTDSGYAVAYFQNSTTTNGSYIGIDPSENFVLVNTEATDLSLATGGVNYLTLDHSASEVLSSKNFRLNKSTPVIWLNSTDTGSAIVDYRNSVATVGAYTGLVNTNDLYLWNREVGSTVLATSNLARLTIDSAGDSTFSGDITVNKVNPWLTLSGTTAADTRLVLNHLGSGYTASDGAALILDSAAVLKLWNYENTDLQIASNNETYLTLDVSGGELLASKNNRIYKTSPRLYLHATDSDTSMIQFFNSTTGSTPASNGFQVGIDSAERPRLFNYSNTSMYIGNNATTQWWFDANGGLYSANATGGSQGIDTINAKAVYDDSVILTCYVPHYIVDGKLDMDEWDEIAFAQFHEPAKEFLDDIGNRINIEDFTRFWKTNKHLPTFPSKEEWNNETRLPIGKTVQKLWETVELLAAHNSQLLDRIRLSEDRIKILEENNHGRK